MDNVKVIINFLEGKSGKTALRNIYGGGFYSYKGRTLTTNGIELINYSTVIAYKKDNVLYLNANKYSITTSKIQSTLKCLAKRYYDLEDIREYK